MKIRMIIGEYEEYETGTPVPQAYLNPGGFPMEVEYLGDDPEGLLPVPQPKGTAP